MTVEGIYNLLVSTGYPVAYSHFKEPPTAPYIVYSVSKNQSGCDEKNLVENLNVRIELYSHNKDLAAEKKIEDILNFTQFDNDETYITEEKLFENIYSFSLLQKIGGI